MPDAPDDDIKARVRVLERAIVQLREQVALSSADAAAARVLAGGADRDVSDVRGELRAHTQSLNALRETQVELLEAQLDLRQSHLDMRQTLLEQGDKITALETEMRAGFATMGTGMAQITALLEGIADSE